MSHTSTETATPEELRRAVRDIAMHIAKQQQRICELGTSNAELEQQRDCLLEACEAADATWNDNATGPGLTERQAIAKLQAAIARARGAQ